MWTRFEGLRIVIVEAHRVDAARAAEACRRALAGQVAKRSAGRSHPDIQSRPHVAEWRRALEGLGLGDTKFPSSIEALGPRALKGRVASISPPVDLYDEISLRHVVPAGGWDLGALRRPLRLGSNGGWRALPGPRWAPRGADRRWRDRLSLRRPGGHRHFVWRQSELGKLTDASEHLLLVSELLGGVSGEVERGLLDDLRLGLRERFGAEVDARVLRPTSPSR